MAEITTSSNPEGPVNWDISSYIKTTDKQTSRELVGFSGYAGLAIHSSDETRNISRTSFIEPGDFTEFDNQTNQESLMGIELYGPSRNPSLGDDPTIVYVHKTIEV